MTTIDKIITSVVNSHKGLAFITNLSTSEIMLANDEYNHYLSRCTTNKPENSKSLNDFIRKESDALVSASLCFCAYVEGKFRENLKTTFATENFCHQSFTSMRTLISYQNQECILTLINTIENDDVIFNSIAQC
ncbi:hypothetical protein AL469_023020 [Vibrio harveyi]|nr:hypothetical protein AL469_023020 [Vibrio harveyi]